MSVEASQADSSLPAGMTPAPSAVFDSMISPSCIRTSFQVLEPVFQI